jgi:methyltransferase-like protein
MTDAASDAANTYDELPYSDRAFVEAHPDRLAVVGTLYGLSPAPVQRCSLLELGCGVGGHLIPMAAALPDSRFVGIDLSAGQIEQGQAVVAELGLGNVELRTQDVMAFADNEGPFDYIVCHGVFSWVPPAVQDRILAICRQCLGEQGLAMISYNTLPGWHQNAAIRDIMLYGARGAAGPAQQVKDALAFLGLVARSLFEPDSPYGQAVRSAAESLAGHDPSYVFHEYLEAFNTPLSFEQFDQRSAAAGLRHVGDAGMVDPSNLLTGEARRVLSAEADDMVRCEQMLDFLRHRTFRRDVLCRQDQPVLRWPEPAALRGLLLLGLADPVADETGRSDPSLQRFRNSKGQVLSAVEPGLKAAMGLLHQVHPQAVTYEELMAHVRSTAGKVNEPALTQMLLSCGMASFVELHTYLPPIAAKAGDLPKAAVSARRQAGKGALVVDLRHRSHRLDELTCAVLSLLDGTRGRTELCEAIRRRIDDGTLKLASAEPPQAEIDVPKVVEEVLEAIAKLCLLQG